MQQQKIITILKEVILKNKGGFSCGLNGKPIKHKDGFFLSITNIKGKMLNHLIKKVLFIKRFGFKNNKNIFIGGWCDGENNFYLDLSLYIKDLKTALNTASLFNQKAIFNIKKMEEVYLK